MKQALRSRKEKEIEQENSNASPDVSISSLTKRIMHNLHVL